MNQPALQLVEAPKGLDDSGLLARARAGEPDAVDQLVRKYLKDVHAVAFRLLGDADLAQDAAQDAMVSALRSLDRFRGDASFRTWIIRITVNAARTIGRRRTRRREVALDVVTDQPLDEMDASSAVVMHDEAARAMEMLKQLPEKQRMAISLRIHQGLSYQEIASVLDCSEGAARVNYHFGVKRLRELMK